MGVALLEPDGSRACGSPRRPPRCWCGHVERVHGVLDERRPEVATSLAELTGDVRMAAFQTARPVGADAVDSSGVGVPTCACRVAAEPRDPPVVARLAATRRTSSIAPPAAVPRPSAPCGRRHAPRWSHASSPPSAQRRLAVPIRPPTGACELRRGSGRSPHGVELPGLARAATSSGLALGNVVPGSASRRRARPSRSRNMTRGFMLRVRLSAAQFAPCLNSVRIGTRLRHISTASRRRRVA